MENSAYEVIPICENAWRIEENGVRSLLFVGRDKALLVDTGFGTGDLKGLVESLTSLPVMLVNTHADGDHLGCNKQFEKAYMHPGDFDYYREKAGKDSPIEPIQEGDIIDLGGRRFEVIHIPGHTPGSIALLDVDNRELISGDSVQSGMIYMFGPGRDIAAYIASLEKLYAIRHKFDTIYPSHGPFPIGVEMLGGLCEGVKQVKDRKVISSPPPYEEDAKLYDIHVAQILYSQPTKT